MAMHRRRFVVSTAIGLAGLPTALHAQWQMEPTIVPAPSTPEATPSSDLPRFEGDLVQIWTEPWEVEGKLVTFKAVIKQREVAPAGSAIAIGSDGGAFRSVLYLYVPLGDGSANELFAVSDSDLSHIRERKTVEVTGTYGGLHGPGWTQPLIIATEIEAASKS